MIVRARARRRLRRIAPPRPGRLDAWLAGTRYGRGLAGRLQAADAGRTPAAFLRLSASAACAGAAVAMVWAGAPAAPAGLLAGLAAPEVALRRRAATRTARVTAQLPEVLAGLATPVRAGASLPQAFAAAAEEAEPPLREVLERTCRDLDGGVEQDRAIERFADRCAVPEARLAARALRVGRVAGTELARVVEEIAETLRERERVARELRAATAQSRTTAAVVAAHPVVFLVLMGAGGGGPARLLFSDPAGWALLGAGGALEAAGLAWIRRLTAPRTPGARR